MEYLRWYDKDPLIKEFMNALERLDQDTISLLAQDFIQIMLEDEQINTDNRWYDKNYDLHSCLEVLKLLNPNLQKKIIEKFKESMYQIIATMYYGNKNYNDE